MAMRARSLKAMSKRRPARRLYFEALEDRRLLTIAHLYTFNDGLASDWVGSAHGTLLNGATATGGQLVLSNAGVTSGQSSVAQFMQLPTDVLNDGDATIEVWFTVGTSADLARVIDIGNQSGTVGETYVYFSPQGGLNDSRAVLRTGGLPELVATGTATDDAAQHMAAIVIDTAANLLRLYIDGDAAGTAPLDGAHAGSIHDMVAYVGRSLFDDAPAFTGSINELRIYDEAVGAEQIAEHAIVGPSTANRSPLLRQMEYLNRGIVAVRSTSTQAYIGWRLLGTDPGGIAFNLYRSAGGGAPVKLNPAPLTQTTDYVDTTANFSQSNVYFVRPIVDGVEQEASESYTLVANAPIRQYLTVPLMRPPGGTVPNYQNPGQTLPFTYNANDASVGDLDGDGQYEIVLKWEPSNAQDNSNAGYTGNVLVDAYRLDGTRLWRIDLGRNIRAGAHYTQIIVYDLDGDGRAEVVMKTAEATVDGVGTVMGNPNADYRNSSGYVLSGPEYLTVFNGLTGAIIDSIEFEPERGSVSSWGDSYGNRVDRFQANVSYLDGVHPSLVWARGYAGPQSGFSARNEVAAYDFRDGHLSLRWIFEAATNGANPGYVGQTAHSTTVGDVDGDGKDEIITGGAALDETGALLYNTGRGHGDALHLTDMLPSRPGLEVFMPHESPSQYGNAGGEFRDARTGQLIFGIPANNDVGRGVAFDIDPNHAGYEMWATTNDPNGGPQMIYNALGQPIYAMPSNMHVNFGVWWDADLLRETLDGTTIGDWNYVTAGRQNFNLASSSRASNNGSKATPSLSADLFGDWREEVIWRRSDNTELQIWTTTIPATNRFYTLMHDPQYRQAIAWQNSGYNQPPHPSFFLGAGMTAPPTPQIYTVRFQPGLAGDYNGDSQVDTADYVVWRRTFGQSGSNLPADGDGDGVVGSGDYEVWLANYGAAGPAGASITYAGGAAASTLPTSPPSAAAAGNTIATNLRSMPALKDSGELGRSPPVLKQLLANDRRSTLLGRPSVAGSIAADLTLVLIGSRSESSAVDSAEITNSLSEDDSSAALDSRDAAFEERAGTSWYDDLLGISPPRAR